MMLHMVAGSNGGGTHRAQLTPAGAGKGDAA